MYSILALIFKYIFIIVIYLFIFSIIRLIYLDIRSMDVISFEDSAYLKLINRKDSLPYKIEEHYLIDGEIKLGRHSGNDIVIKDQYISKNHFQIVEDEGDYYLEDLDSVNGTFLNGDKLFDIVRLEDGDIIRVGKIEFLFVNRE
ncbi:MAG: FHA domain-containing protein [Tissierellaceae bacterium]